MKLTDGALWQAGNGMVAVVPGWRGSRRWPTQWRKRLGRLALLSLLIHAIAILLLLLSPPPPHRSISDEAPPGEVALVFEGGSRTAPASPTPSLETSIGPPSADAALSAPPAGAIPPPDATPPSPPTTMDSAPPAFTDAPLAPPPAITAPPVPPLAFLPAPTPVPQAIEPPTPTPPAAAHAAPPRPAPPVRPAPSLRPRATPRTDAFPRPLFAFGSPFDGHGSTGRAPPHESLGPLQAGPVSRSSFNSDIKGNLGPDYRNLLRAWLERHKYYPPQAAEEGEDGTASVHVVIRRDGSVRLVELEERSGSQWLDMGAQALFRGQRLPAFPSDAMGEEQEIVVTIHYILIRG